MDFPAYMTNAIAAQAAQYGAAGLGAGALAYKRYRKPKPSLVKQIYRNRGELHNKQHTGSLSVAANTATVFLLNDISQGDDSDDRSGRHITNYGYKMTGKVNDRSLDVFIVHSKSGIAPVLADFQPIIGGHLKDESNKDFKVIRDLRDYHTLTTYFRASKRWRRGYDSAYANSAGTSIVKNGFYLVLLNNTPIAQSTEYSIDWYYRDH